MNGDALRFNINQSVRIRLTDLGRTIHRREHEDLRRTFPKLGPYVPPREDAEGWSTWQLWAVMSMFGDYVGMARELPFETEIQLLENS